MEIASATDPTAQFRAATADGSASDSDYETFLKMLTVQMTNQDPLNPVESADFAVQLATFSSVEQQVRANELLAGLQSQFGTLALSQLAGWVGMEALVSSSALFDQKPIEVAVEPDLRADQAWLVVADEAGKMVDRVQIDPEAQRLTWSGTLSNGQTLPTGIYSFETESYFEGEHLGNQEAAVFSPIVEARTENGVVLLQLDSGEVVGSAEVAALRRPD